MPNMAFCVLYRPAYAGQNTPALLFRAAKSVLLHKQTSNGYARLKEQQATQMASHLLNFYLFALWQIRTNWLVGAYPQSP